VSFLAPASLDLSAVVAAGTAGGLSPSAAIAADGQGGTFDYQRSSNAAGDTIFYSGYSNVSNFGVGAYLYGAGFTHYGANTIANAFAFFKSSNAGDPVILTRRCTKTQAIRRRLAEGKSHAADFLGVRDL